MIMRGKPIVMAERCQIENFDAVANNFFATVLDMDYGDCFVSDESCLSDFSSCGMPESLGPKNSSIQSLYAAWDAWIIPEIARRYGVELTATSVTLVDLFNRITQAKSARVH